MKVFTVARGVPNAEYPQNGIFEYDQARALAIAGAHVTVLALDMRPWNVSRKHGMKCYDTVHGIHVVQLSLPTGAYRKGMPVLRFLLGLMYRKAVAMYGRPDVIHAHFYFLGAIAAGISTRYGIPLVLTEHSSKMNCPLADISMLDRKIAGEAYGSADKVIAVSGALAERLKENFGLNPVVISNVADVSNFGYWSRSGHDYLRDGHFRFVSVGNLIPLKRFDLLLQAFSDAFGNRVDVSLKIIGGGPELPRLQEMAGELGISGQVAFTGPLSRESVRDELYSADAFVLVSSTETFGLAYAEAMATGLPVIATACGGPSDFVDEYNGFLIPVDDRKAVSNALLNMIDSYSWFDGKEISQSISRRFSPEFIGEKILSVLSETVSRHLKM